MNTKRKALLSLVVMIVASIIAQNSIYAKSERTAEAVNGTPVIDGEIDDIWQYAETYDVDGYAIGVATDTTGRFRAMWDADYLYVLVEVNKHGIPVYDGFVNEDNDAPEIAWSENANFDGIGNVNNDDPSAGVFRVDANNELSGLGVMCEDAIADGSFKAEFKKVSDDTYRCEFAIPFKNVTPAVGSAVSFECQININSANAGRDAIIYWTETGNAWTNSSDHGTLNLVAAPVIETEPEPEPEPAVEAETAAPTADSSETVEQVTAPVTSDYALNVISVLSVCALAAFVALLLSKRCCSWW